MIRKKIFISHASPDGAIAPLLARLLELHGHEPWFAQADLRAGDHFDAQMQDELASADTLIVIVSRHTAASTWVITEVAKFRALETSGDILPYIVDDFPRSDLDRISPGLSRAHAIDGRRSMLEGFERLFAALGNDFLSRRELTDRRRASERRTGQDRRTAGARQRLSLGLLVTYTRRSGKSVSESTRLTARDLDALREPALEELSRYAFRDPHRREDVSPERALARAFDCVTALIGGSGSMDAIEVLRRIATNVCDSYDVRPADRRRRERRR
jgi:hypothetical protein